MKRLLTILTALIMSTALYAKTNAVKSETDPSEKRSKHSISYRDEENLIRLNVALSEDGSFYIFDAEFKTEGWTALGFNPLKMMKGAEIIMMYTDTNGKAQLRTHYGHTAVSHKEVEPKSNAAAELISYEVKDGITHAVFKKPVGVGGKYSKKLTRKKDLKLIYAFGKGNDPESYHAERGTFWIKLP